MSIASKNNAASEALTQLVPLSGEYPSRDRDVGTIIPLGSIRTFAGDFADAGGHTLTLAKLVKANLISDDLVFRGLRQIHKGSTW